MDVIVTLRVHDLSFADMDGTGIETHLGNPMPMLECVNLELLCSASHLRRLIDGSCGSWWTVSSHTMRQLERRGSVLTMVSDL